MVDAAHPQRVRRSRRAGDDARDRRPCRPSRSAADGRPAPEGRPRSPRTSCSTRSPPSASGASGWARSCARTASSTRSTSRRSSPSSSTRRSSTFASARATTPRSGRSPRATPAACGSCPSPSPAAIDEEPHRRDRRPGQPEPPRRGRRCSSGGRSSRCCRCAPRSTTRSASAIASATSRPRSAPSRARDRSSLPRRRATAAPRLEALQDAPVVQIVNLLVAQALRDRASDLHLEPHASGLRIRARVDGILREVAELPADLAPGLVEPDQDPGRAQHRREAARPGRPDHVRYRRPEGRRPRGDDADDLGREGRHAPARSRSIGPAPHPARRPRRRPARLPAAARRRATAWSSSPGPTGSGKTTTLYASINELDRAALNVTTIEDPVEYTFENVNQTQVNAAARPHVRPRPAGDPAPGPRRDPRRRDARPGDRGDRGPGVDDRAPRALVDACDRCRERALPTAGDGHRALPGLGQPHRRHRPAPDAPRLLALPDRDRADRRGARPSTRRPACRRPRHAYLGRGCTYCAGTGYLDRIGAYELLRVTPDIRRLWPRTPTTTRSATRRSADGMVPMRTDALRKAAAGVTTVSEALRGVSS